VVIAARARQQHYGGMSSGSDDANFGDSGTSSLGVVELSFCVFPSLKPVRTPEEEQEHQRQRQQGGYVPWELQAPPWRRLAKWVRKKYIVAGLARGKPAVLVIQTNYAPEHPNRAHIRTKTLLSWAAKELSVRGELRLVLRGQIPGVGSIMGRQLDAAEEREAKANVRAFLAEMGEDEPTAVAVIACFQGAGFEPSSWLPQLEKLLHEGMDYDDWEEEEEEEEEEGRGEEGEEKVKVEDAKQEDGEEAEHGEEGQGEDDQEQSEEEDEGGPGMQSPLLQFIEGVKMSAGLIDDPSSAAEDDDTEAEAEAEPEPEPEPEPSPNPEAEAAATAAQQQLEERVTVAARVMDEERGLGLATRQELQDLLQRCADGGGQSVSLERNNNETYGTARWQEWDQLLWTPPQEREVLTAPTQQLPESVLAHMSKKEKRKKQNRKDRQPRQS
jgi:hypothetical protein